MYSQDALKNTSARDRAHPRCGDAIIHTHDLATAQPPRSHLRDVRTRIGGLQRKPYMYKYVYVPYSTMGLWVYPRTPLWATHPHHTIVVIDDDGCHRHHRCV